MEPAAGSIEHVVLTILREKYRRSGGFLVHVEELLNLDGVTNERSLKRVVSNLRRLGFEIPALRNRFKSGKIEWYKIEGDGDSPTEEPFSYFKRFLGRESEISIPLDDKWIEISWHPAYGDIKPKSRISVEICSKKSRGHKKHEVIESHYIDRIGYRDGGGKEGFAPVIRPLDYMFASWYDLSPEVRSLRDHIRAHMVQMIVIQALEKSNKKKKTAKAKRVH